MDNSDLEISEPVEKSLLIGDSKVLKYQIKNTTEFRIKDIYVTVDTVKSDGVGGKISTDVKYASIIGDIPKTLGSFKSADVMVEVKIPQKYSEYITKNGEKRLVPFSILLKAKGVKYIEEL